MQTPDSKPLFSLTAEEVGLIKPLIQGKIDEPSIFSRTDWILEEKEPYSNLLTRIKQWQDGNKFGK